MSWECHRCHRVLNDLTPGCNCPPSTVVATSTAGDCSGLSLPEMMVEAARAIAGKPDTLAVAKAWLAYMRDHPGCDCESCDHEPAVEAIIAGRMP